MRKVLFLNACLLLSSAVFAESMKFVTFLSSPVGTFSRLETADYQKPMQVEDTTMAARDADKTIRVVSPTTEGAAITELTLVDVGMLKANSLPVYRIARQISLNEGGNIVAKGLLAGDVDFLGQVANMPVKNTLYTGNDITATAAGTVSLNIMGVASYEDGPQYKGTFSWCQSEGDENTYYLSTSCSDGSSSGGGDDSGSDSDRYVWTISEVETQKNTCLDRGASFDGDPERCEEYCFDQIMPGKGAEYRDTIEKECAQGDEDKAFWYGTRDLNPPNCDPSFTEQTCICAYAYGTFTCSRVSE